MAAERSRQQSVLGVHKIETILVRLFIIGSSACLSNNQEIQETISRAKIDEMG